MDIIDGILRLVYADPPRCRLCSRTVRQAPMSRQTQAPKQTPTQRETPIPRQAPRGYDHTPVMPLGLCSSCLAELIWIDGTACEICGRILGESQPPQDGIPFQESQPPQKGRPLQKIQPSQEGMKCYDCQKRGVDHTFFARNRSAVQYNQKMREVLALYKYRGKESLQQLFVDLLHKAYLNHYARAGLSFDLITYVPLHARRQRERGFNQAQRLAEGLSGRLNLPLFTLLVRNKETDKQSKKSRQQRINTLHGAFSISPLLHHLGQDCDYSRDSSRDSDRGSGFADDSPIYDLLFGSALNVLLVDDVYTTGSTVNECAKVLRTAGIAGVYVLTVAR